MSNQRKKQGPGTYFVTGYPGFIGKRLVEHIAREDPQGHIYALVQPKFLKEAQKLAAHVKGATLELITGDIVDMHLGLSGEEYQRLCERVTDIFHLAAVAQLNAPKETSWRVNVDGTRNMLELARDCEHLRRFNTFSSCYVSGDRLGVIAEDELDAGQGFRNPYEESKFHAEKLVQRASATLPTTIFRPCSVVGDSRTGEIDRFEGPYYLGVLLVTSPLVAPLPLPGNGVAPLNVVPVDYVVAAVWHISRDPRGVGRTFHLVDPNPMSARRVYERIAEKSNRKLPRFQLPARAADVVLRLPVLEKLARPQRAALSYVNHLVIYNTHNTLELLDGTGIRCPPLATYLDQLVAYVREQYRKRQESAEVEDPLDHSSSPGSDTPDTLPSR
ncbi:SDR family oxidoreductase [Stigmatella erecta]|uniref:Thioester reductase domain-containing protein n=1 Tax=Stigmatella erecta TaxID=83460 RepID=A0A1I0L2Z2_9BACT|nr:SDR family oxidoreductase [Stigmatella erecta]SEU33078.1 Thioester reductase domain-containing protein [Stigmatella erecta]